MKLYFWSIGKPNESYVKEGIDLFTKRLNHYFAAEWKIIPSPKNASGLAPDDVKIKEEEIILNFLEKDDFLILLDERGKLLNNDGLAKLIQQRANESTKTCIFLIGGAFGVGKKYNKGQTLPGASLLWFFRTNW